MNVDYSHWLGPGYKSLPEERVSTYVANHMGYPDAPGVLYSLKGNVSFLAADHVAHVPFVGTLVTYLEGLFCPRGGTLEEKKKIVDLIAERQRSTEEGTCTKSPIMIFPEGSTSNNTHLVKFKRGAFESMCSVKPLTIKYHSGGVDCNNSTLADYWIVILLCT